MNKILILVTSLTKLHWQKLETTACHQQSRIYKSTKR